MWDLLLKGGQVVDPVNGINDVMDVAIEDGRVAAVGKDLVGKTKAIEDCSGLIVMPGVIDCHLHLGSTFGGPNGMRMAALSGVTSCIDMAGPLGDILAHGHTDGAGLNVAIMDCFYPTQAYGVHHPTRAQVADYIDRMTAGGAIGIKLIGGHFPLPVETCRDMIELCYEKHHFVAWHAGSDTSKSDIDGMREAVETAAGLPLHLAHVNSYCRGRVRAPEQEAAEAIELLKANPNIFSDAYLSPLNGTMIDANDDGSLPDFVTRCCLEIFKLPVNADGMREAFKRGLLFIMQEGHGVTDIVGGAEGLAIWEAAGGKGMGCFTVNPAVSRLMLAQAKRDDGSFVVDSISTDGGVVPRNVIVPMGINLVKFGALTLPEFVQKASVAGARYLRIKDRGHLSVGAVADITIVDYSRSQAVETIVSGCVNMKNGYLYGQGMRVITSEVGAKAVRDKGHEAIVVDMTDMKVCR